MKRNMFKKIGLGLLSLLFLVMLVIAITPKQSTAQVLKPCDTLGCTMFGGIFFNTNPPVVTGTGTPTIVTGSSNFAGQVTAGASATSVVITFSNGGFSAIPNCNVNNQSQVTSFAYTVSKTVITVTQTATSGNLINYHCDPLA